MPAGMHAEDALIVITVPASAPAARTHQLQDGRLWDRLDETLRASQLGHVTGYTSGHGRHQAQILVDRVSWEETWEVLRNTLALLGLLGAATVHL
jgi:hypothetical protein